MGFEPHLIWEYPCPPSYSSSDAQGSSASKSSTADISSPNSLLSSLRTTPDLKLIDPRILDPPWPGTVAHLPSTGHVMHPTQLLALTNLDKTIIYEEGTDDPTISHLDALHLDDH